MILWLELPDWIVLGVELVAQRAPGALREALLRVMARPMVGPPRRPARIRVADEASAAELRPAVPGISVRVAATPELATLVHELAEFLPSEEGAASYLEEGRIAPEAVRRLFAAAESLYRLAPWRIASEEQLLRLDIPELGLVGACVSIIGELGESRGFLIFPSLDGFDAFAQAAEAPQGSPLDLGTTVRSLTFEPATELPPRMRSEAESHGWPVAAKRAYPLIEHRDRDGLPRPLGEEDVRITAACASALTRFVDRHRALFKKDFPRPVSETSIEETGLSVRLTAPYEEDLDRTESGAPAGVPVRAPAKVARNAPCPCGSGAKYKKCCLPKDEAQRHEAGRPAAVHTLDERLVLDMVRFARGRFAAAWQRAAEDFEDAEAALQLFFPWSVYGFPLPEDAAPGAGGQTVVERFLAERGRSLTPEVRAWLRAQQRSWLTIWEVLAVEPGRVTVRDLLSGEERVVHEVSGSRTLTRRDSLLGRVVSDGDLAVFCGMHPGVLPPLEAAEVVRRVRARLRRQGLVPVERLRDGDLGRYLIRRWEEAVGTLARQRARPPVLRNTDGDDLLLTVDHFGFAPAQRREIEARLLGLEGVEPPDGDEGTGCFTFLQPGNRLHASWDNTLVGRAVLGADSLRLETNSVRRADALRQRVEGACAGLLRHKAREHTDPLARLSDAPDGPPEPSVPARLDRDEETEALRELKQRHYAGWLDEPLPALGGQTPRQAVRRKAGRSQVDALLKHFENHESRLPPDEQIDFSGFRTELGLDGT